MLAEVHTTAHDTFRKVGPSAFNASDRINREAAHPSKTQSRVSLPAQEGLWFLPMHLSMLKLAAQAVLPIAASHIAFTEACSLLLYSTEQM